MSRERVLHPQRGVAQAALLIAAAIGLCVVLGTLWLQSEPPAERYSEPSVEYGRQLIRDTARNMGPAHLFERLLEALFAILYSPL